MLQQALLEKSNSILFKIKEEKNDGKSNVRKEELIEGKASCLG